MSERRSIESHLTVAYRIRAAFHSLSVPPNVPHALFFEWRSDVAGGESKSFRPTVETFTDFGETIDYEEYQKTESAFAFTLIAKPLFSPPFVLARADISVPPDVFAGFSGVSSFPIESPVGIFTLRISFTVLPHEKVARDRPKLNPARFLNMIDDLAPILYDRAAAAELWGSSGIISELDGFRGCQTDAATLDGFSMCHQTIQKVARRSRLYGAFFRFVVNVVARGDCECWSAAHGVIVFDPARGARENLVPTFGIAIAHAVNLFLAEPDTSDLIERFVVDICALSVGLVADPGARDVWLVWLLSGVYFVISFLKKIYPGSMTGVVMSLTVIARQVLVVFIRQWVATLRQWIAAPVRLRAFIERYHGIFTALSIPAPVWNQVVEYIFRATDYYAASACIFESTADAVACERFIAAFPEFAWPLLSGLHFIVVNADAIVTGTMPLAKVPEPVRGQWIGLIINKLNETTPWPEKKVAAVAQADQPAPAIEGIEKFVDLNGAFGAVAVTVPDSLPTLPGIEEATGVAFM